MSSKRFYHLFFSFLFIFTLFGSVFYCGFGGNTAVAATAATRQTAGAIRIPLPECDVASQVDANGFCRFTGNGVQQISQVGEPSIPYKAVTVLLPPNANLSTVKATITDSRWAAIDGQYDIQPVPPLATGDCENTCAVSPTDEAIIDGKNADIYGTDASFPLEPIGKVDTQVMRGWKMAQILYAPYAYNPVEKQIFQLSGNAIEITFERDLLKSNADGIDFTGAGQVREITANFAEMAGEYGGFAVSADTGRYVIITTSAIQAASSSLMDFVASKEARGFTVQVVNEGTWGGSTGDTAAEHIRSWLQANYIGLNIRYVLLMGNPNPTTGDVPMKMCYPQKADPNYPDCPTDFYYAELTSNWNSDGDGMYGEFDDDFSGNPPRAAEVAVGRIPYYGSIADLDHILLKIIQYETTPDSDISWRRNILLPMKPSDGSTPGYQLGEEIKDDILVPNDWEYHRVYESNYGLSPAPETTPCTYDNVKTAWNGSNFGAVFWWTHGSETTASDIMNLTNASTLDDAHPSFTFQCSCSNGKPEASTNLQYSLLKNGCISTVSASRVSWYEPGQTSFAETATNSGMTFEYSQRLIAGEMYAGDALNDLRFDVSPYPYQELWMNYLDFNLYGCPAVGLFTSTPDPAVLSVWTDYAKSVTTSSARLRGNLTSLGTASSVTVSFVWGTSPGSYPNESNGQFMTSTGTFYSDLGGLSPSTTYYCRAKAVGASTVYGVERSFTTLTSPTVSTNGATNVTTSSARLNGDLTSLGTASSVTVSFVWGTSSGSYPNETTGQVKTGTGTFYFDQGSLSPTTTYRYRAKAVGDSTVYGLEKSFTTLPASAPNGWYEQYTTSSSGSSLYGPNWRYQNFTPSTSHNLNTVSLYLYKQGAPNYTVTIGIYNVDANNKPTGSALRSATFAASSVTTTATWYTYTFATGCQVSAGSKYAIVLSGNGGNISNRVNVGYNMSGGYSRGVFGSSSNSGGTWSVSSYQDMAFKEGQSPDQSAPTITSVSPNEGMQGQTLSNVIITGSYFTGATVVDFGPGITVSFTVNSSTQITANITISGSATLGSRNVSVTTPYGTATLTNGFTVKAPSLPSWYEQFTTASYGKGLYGTNWMYQTFTPATSHSLNGVSLYLYKQGSPNYAVTIGLYNVDANNKPTGAPLCSTTVAASSLTTTATWYTCTFATGCQVSAGSKYAIVLSGNGGDYSNRVNVRYNMSGGYSRGVFGSSSNSGGTWSVSSYQDMAFKEGQL